LERDLLPTLWTNQLFLPGQYPLEVLEKELRSQHFAVLVASPDDEVIKRSVTMPAMRDNLLLEFGLFSGALGRGRAFFLCPATHQVALPSDILGMITATYDDSKVALSASDRAAAVQTPCAQILAAIKQEWHIILQNEEEMALKIRAAKETQSVQRLYTVATRLRDVLFGLQRDAFAALSDRPAFEQVKQRTADEVRSIAESFRDDARTVGTEAELDALQAGTHDALLDLPFPEELALGRDAAKRQAMGVGMAAFDTFLRGGDPLRHVQDAVSDEASGRLSSLSGRYSEWWQKHSPRLQEATAHLQDALMSVVIKVAAQQSRET
jgi:hypothetical protein